MLKRYLPLVLVIAALATVLAFILTPAKGGQVINVNNEQFSKVRAQGVPIIDVRTPEEFAASHIPGAVNVPMDQLNDVSAGWDPAQPVAVYCATGARSANAAQILEARGFAKVYNLTQGIAAWDGETENGAGSASGSAPMPLSVETSGRPVFIDFAGSN